jgi:hypothetical protein
MSIDELRKYRNADPFSPFLVHLADGRVLRVNQPHNVAHDFGKTCVIVGNGDWNIVELDDIKKLEQV